MSTVSGVVSRQILPACGNLCFFCPSMRSRSRQPVKRYKKLLAAIFQDEVANDRKISKLCEYAAKNPLRIPEIASFLEQRCYKDLRNEKYQSVKTVMLVFRKIISSCKEHMTLFANSMLTAMQTLLDANQDELIITGSQSLCDFVKNQKDGTYMSYLEKFIPKLCQLAQEVGEVKRVLYLRSAGLQALCALVWLMGESSHISVEFDNIISVVLENYVCPTEDINQSNQNTWNWEVPRDESHVSPSPDVGHLNLSVEVSMKPSLCSKLCLQNMAKLGKESSVMRPMMESLFRYFDTGNLWSLKTGTAFPVLREIQILIDDSGQDPHFLLSILIKHLDHKNVHKQPEMQLDIIHVVTALCKHAKVQASVAIASSISYTIRHLQKSLHCLLYDSNVGPELSMWNKRFNRVVEECLRELLLKVRDADLILDTMANILESIPNVATIARTTISTLCRVLQIVVSLPNLSYRSKAFPETLFQQILAAMLHPDHETRVGVHQFFSMILHPFSFSPQTDSTIHEFDKNKALRAVSVSCSSTVMFKKLRDQKNHAEKDLSKWNNENHSGDLVPLGLNSHQISQLFSSVWKQSISADNQPGNFIAIAHTYSLALLFSLSKQKYLDALTQSFQIAFSLRDLSLLAGGTLPPSRRRSLFAMSTSMIIIALQAYNVRPPIPSLKAVLSGKEVDPFLRLDEDSKLISIEAEPWQQKILYGSKEDNVSALRCLSEIRINEDQSRKALVSAILKNLDNLTDHEGSFIRDELQKEFLPDDLCVVDKYESLQERASLLIPDEDSFSNSIEYQLSTADDSILPRINQLLHSVQTVNYVRSMSIYNANDASFKEVVGQCEKLSMAKLGKTSFLLDEASDPFLCRNTYESRAQTLCGTQEMHQFSDPLRLPPSSPYDNFLKTAGLLMGS